MLKSKLGLKIQEFLAVAFSLAYTILYAYENPWCWLFAFLGSGLFVYLCYIKRIYAESFLQLFYVGMAIYGYVSTDGSFLTVEWSSTDHIWIIVSGIIATTVLGVFLKKRTDSAVPFVDAFTTVFSILATWVMVNYVHANWLYWIVIDAVSIWLYYQRKLYFGAVLFVIYLVISVSAYFDLM